MMSPDSGHEKPSRYIASTNGKWPILWPQRASAASTRYGMRLIDSMPPATTHRRLAEQEALRARGDRLQTRGTRLVDGLGRGRVRKTGAMADLTRRVRPGAGLPAVPDQHFVDRLGGYAGALRAPPARRPHRARRGGCPSTCRHSGRSASGPPRGSRRRATSIARDDIKRLFKCRRVSAGRAGLADRWAQLPSAASHGSPRWNAARTHNQVLYPSRDPIIGIELPGTGILVRDEIGPVPDECRFP